LCSCRRISSAPISRSTSFLMLLKLRLSRPIHRPALRAASGKRSGPSTIKATRATSSSSLKPTSNMIEHYGRVRDASSVFLDRVFDLARFAFDGLPLLLFYRGRRLVIVGANRLAKALDRIAKIGTQALEALGAEQHDDDEQDDEQLPDADTAESHDVSPGK